MSVVREKIMHYSDVYTAASVWSYWRSTYECLRKIGSPKAKHAKRKLREAEQELLQACSRPLSYYSR